MNLKLAQARYRFGLLSGADLVAAAARLIEEGADNSTACELAFLKEPTLRDAGPLFERVLTELGIPTPSAAEARTIVAADIGQAIVTGAVSPRDGFAELEDLSAASGGIRDLWPWDPWQFYDDGWPEDRRENAARHAEIDKSVVEAARTMLARLALRPGNPQRREPPNLSARPRSALDPPAMASTPTEQHDIFAALRARAVSALAELLPDLPPDAFARVQMEPPRDAAHGDMATNAAMVVAKAARQPPPKLAAALAERLSALPEVAEAAPAGPGFVNLRLREGFLRAQLPVILHAGESYGDGAVGQGRRVDVEYVSANPTGPMHVGHCRGAVVGDALANLLTKANYAVTKEYYVNDAGAQVQALAQAAYWRYLQALGTTMTEEEYAATVPGGLQYGGDYLIPVGETLRERHGDSLAAPGARPADPVLWLDTVRDFTVEAMMAAIRDDLAALGVRHDVFVSERALIAEGKLEQAEALLASKDLIYYGILEPPKGKTPEDWEPREQELFRATRFGDEVDRPLRKSDGTGTYFANDIANHLHKLERGFSELVHVWGADHGGYVKRMKAAVAALSDNKVPLDVVLTQIVRVVKNGEPVRMSKRAGTYVALRDLIDEVGKDAVRFTMLTRKADAQMEFDLDKVVEQSRDNPVFYVQYAHARCRSVLRAAGAPAVPDLIEAPLDALADPAEMALIRRLAAWPRTVEAAAEAREPHRIAFFLHDLAAEFHVLWNKGRDDATLRFIQGDEPVATRARLALVAATAAVIRSGLAVMGVAPAEEMR